jgi:hypothetical protein
VRTGTAAVRGGSTQPECTRRESAAASPLPAMPWWRSAQLPRVSCATTSIFVAVAAVASGAPAGRSSTAQHAGAAGAAAAAAAAAWPPTNASGWVGNTGRNAVLNATEPWESACVCEPQVVWEPDHSRYRMWYRGGWGPGQIGVATSPDGRVFTKDPHSPVYGGEQPHVFRVPGGQYWLHTNQGTSGKNTSIARSDDGVHWTEVKTGVSFEEPAGKSGGGNRVFWRQEHPSHSGPGSGGEAKWLCLQEFGMFGNIYQIFLYSSPDGLAWKLENDGKPVQGLQPAPGAPVSGPAFASVEGVLRPRGPDGRYSLWYHATNGTGLTPSDIFHAYSDDLIHWSDIEIVVRHTGSNDEFDQAADPHPVVGGKSGGEAFLYFDGENNPKSQCHVMAVTAAAATPSSRGTTIAVPPATTLAAAAAVPV